MAKSSILFLWVVTVLHLFDEVSACCTFCDFCCPSLSDPTTNEIRRYCCDGDHSNPIRNAPDECRKMTSNSAPCEDCCDWFDHHVKPIVDPPEPCCKSFPLDIPCKKCYCCLNRNYVGYWCNSKPCSPDCIPVASKKECESGRSPANPFGFQNTLNVTNIAALTFGVTAVTSTSAQCSFRAIDSTGYVGVDYQKRSLSDYDDGVLAMRRLGDGKMEVDFDCGCAAQGNGVHQAPHGQIRDVIIECNEKVEFINPSIQDCTCGASNGNVAFCRDGKKEIGDPREIDDCTDYDIDCDTCKCGSPPPPPPSCDGPGGDCRCRGELGDCGSSVPTCTGGYLLCLPVGNPEIVGTSPTCDDDGENCSCPSLSRRG